MRLDDKCSYKISERELFDTLLFEQGPTEILKIYEKTEMYRFAVGLSALRRLLMYRGNTINVNHIVAEVKK